MDIVEGVCVVRCESIISDATAMHVVIVLVCILIGVCC